MGAEAVAVLVLTRRSSRSKHSVRVFRHSAAFWVVCLHYRAGHWFLFRRCLVCSWRILLAPTLDASRQLPPGSFSRLPRMVVVSACLPDLSVRLVTLFMLFCHPSASGSTYFVPGIYYIPRYLSPCLLAYICLVSQSVSPLLQIQLLICIIYILRSIY